MADQSNYRHLKSGPDSNQRGPQEEPRKQFIFSTTMKQKQARAGMNRCCRALGLTGPDDLLPIMEPSGDHCIAGTKISRAGKLVPRVHMNGTTNSKRFIHVYLWWMKLLGPFYPIGDNLLRDPIWKQLHAICIFGLQDSCGHLPESKQMCIAPAHYCLSLSQDVGRAFIADLQELCADESYHKSATCVAFLSAITAMLGRGDTFLEIVTYIRANCPVFPGHPVPKDTARWTAIPAPPFVHTDFVECIPPLLYVGPPPLIYIGPGAEPTVHI